MNVHNDVRETHAETHMILEGNLCASADSRVLAEGGIEVLGHVPLHPKLL